MSTSRPRVLIIAPGQHSRGGMDSMLNTVMDSELNRRYELTRLSLHRDGTAMRKIRAAAAGFRSMLWALMTSKPDVAWVHATKGASLQRKSIAVLLLRAAGVPTLMHLHSERAVESLERASGPVRWLTRTALGQCAVVVVLDASWVPRLASMVRADYRYVPNPVDVPVGVDRDSVHRGQVVQVGSLSEGKGVYTSLESFAAIRRACPGATLHFVGDGPAAADLRRRVDSSGVANAVTIHGWLPHDRALRIVESSECVVLPSEAEGLPMALLEAMARAVPVVATPVGGVPQLLEGGKCGLLVPIGAADRLASEVIRVLTDAAFAEALGQAGRRRVIDGYSTPVFVNAMSSVLDSAVAQDPRSDTFKR